MPTLLTAGSKSSHVMLIGESPTSDDIFLGIPFVSGAGRTLRSMLHDAGWPYPNAWPTTSMADMAESWVKGPIFLTLASNKPLESSFISTAEAKSTHALRWRNAYPTPELLATRTELLSLIAEIKPRLIITCGSLALWTLWPYAGTQSVKDKFKPNSAPKILPVGASTWRGSKLHSPDTNSKLLPILHPAAIQRQWEFRPITVHDLKRAFRESLYPEVRHRSQIFITRPTYKQTLAHLDSLISRQSAVPRLPLAVDIETRNNGYITYPDCIGIAESPNNAICIPLTSTPKRHGHWTPQQEAQIILRLRTLFTSPSAYIVGQNFAYDAMHIARYYGFIPRLRFDTMLAQHSFLPGMPKDLAYLSSLYCEHYTYWKDDLHGTDDDTRWTYNCRDCCYTWEVHAEQRKIITSLPGGISRFDYLHSLWWPIFHLMLRGSLINTTQRATLANELDLYLSHYDSWFNKVLDPLLPYGNRFSKTAKPWHGSPAQILRIFTEIFKLPFVSGKNKKQEKSADELALAAWGMQEPILKPLTDALILIRSLRIFKTTFLDAPLTNNRMYASWNIAGPETYRFSSSSSAFGEGTGMMTIPKGDK